MPRKQPYADDTETASLSGEEDDSDPEDYIVNWGGLTTPEAKSGSKNIHFDTPTKTFIFKHAISQQYCSKLPPSANVLIHLINSIGLPKQGLRVTSRFIQSLAAWIYYNVSQRSLAGLLVESSVGIRGRTIVYAASISKALVEAVDAPTFSYDEIAAISNVDSAVCQQHARQARIMLPFGPASPGPRPSMGEVVRSVISHMVETGQIVPSSRSNPRRPQPLFTWPDHGPSHLPILPLLPTQLQPNYSPGEGQPLYEADKILVEQNRQSYEEWFHYVSTSMGQAQADGRAFHELPVEVQEAWQFNVGEPAYNPGHDYIGWLIAHHKKHRAV